MKTWLPFTLMAALLIAVGVGAYLLLDFDDSPKIRVADERGDDSDQNAKLLHSAEADSTPEQRIRALDKLNAAGGLKSNSSALRKTIVSDPAEEVQLHALEIALRSAAREGANATSGVVQTALASTFGNTRARGLKAAREHPDPGLVPELVALVDNRDPYAAMALNALAYMDSAEAREKVFSVAQDSTTEPKLRERAVALLAVTKEREARPLLIELANGENESLARIAQEVLKVLNED